MSVLNATERSPESKPKQLRRAGVIPMAVVDKGETKLIQATAVDVAYAISHVKGAGMLDLKLENEKAERHVMLKQVDRDPLGRHIEHVTWQQVSKDDKVKTDLPVVALGTPAAVTDESGVLVHPSDKLSVRGKVSDLPDQIEVDISAMEINTSIHAGDVQLPDGVELMSSPDSILFSLQPAKDLMAEIEAEQAAEAEAAAAEEAAPEATEEE